MADMAARLNAIRREADHLCAFIGIPTINRPAMQLQSELNARLQGAGQRPEAVSEAAALFGGNFDVNKLYEMVPAKMDVAPEGREAQLGVETDPLFAAVPNDIDSFLSQRREAALLNTMNSSRDNALDAAVDHWTHAARDDWSATRVSIHDLWSSQDGIAPESLSLSRRLNPVASQDRRRDEIMLDRPMADAFPANPQRFDANPFAANQPVEPSVQRFITATRSVAVTPGDKPALALAQFTAAAKNTAVVMQQTPDPIVDGDCCWETLGKILADRSREGDSVPLQLEEYPAAVLANRSRAYLEDKFLEKVKRRVAKNVFNGNPSPTDYIKGYLKEKHHFAREQAWPKNMVIGKCEYPLWGLIYYHLRCGLAQEACAFASEISWFDRPFASYVKHKRTFPDEQVRGVILDRYHEFRHRRANDPYMLLVLNMLTKFDRKSLGFASDIFEDTYDQVWYELTMLNSSDREAFNIDLAALQEYYWSNARSANEISPFFPAQIFLLTLQFNRAIKYLWDERERPPVPGKPLPPDARCKAFAVHLAITLYLSDVLVQPTPKDVDFGKSPFKDSAFDVEMFPAKRDHDAFSRGFFVNVPKLIYQYLTYISANETFTKRDSIPALWTVYFSLIKDKTQMENCLARVVIKLADVGGLIGNDGEVLKIIPDDRTITKIRQDLAIYFEMNGDLENAIYLYDLSDNTNKVITLLTARLAQVITQEPNEERTRIMNQAAGYETLLPRLHETVQITNFRRIRTLGMCFDHYFAGCYDDALNLLNTLDIIPLKSDDHPISAYAEHLPKQGKEITTLISDILRMALLCLDNTSKMLRSYPKGYNGAQMAAQQKQVDEQIRNLYIFQGMIPSYISRDVNDMFQRLTGKK